MLDTLNAVGQLIIVDAIVGETIVLKTHDLQVGATRFDTESPTCPNDGTSVSISQEYTSFHFVFVVMLCKKNTFNLKYVKGLCM